MKALVLYNQLFHYRIPIFKILAEEYDLTVAYSFGKVKNEKYNFQAIRLPVLKFGRFIIHKSNIFKLCSGYDVVIVYGDIAWLKLSTLPFHKKRKFRVIFWSPGVSASYKKKYDAVTKWDNIRDIFYKKADALVFYSEYPIDKYVKRGFEKQKLFVAPNTVEVYQNFERNNSQKDSLLFIGTLYMQKGVSALLENYKLAYMENQNLPRLNIIGGGDEFSKVELWIKENNLETKIFLLGPVFDIIEKSKYFKKAIACISPFQAGLAVLESMGYGVPFITMKDAITGGERLNIQSGLNGVLLENEHQIKDTIIDISYNKEKYLNMGNVAAEFYNTKRKPSDMANGLKKAIEYVSGK